jgi:hypothetical protein
MSKQNKILETAWYLTRKESPPLIFNQKNQGAEYRRKEERRMKGGYRPGAGRPKGAKTKHNKAETVADINAAASENLTPLEYMLKIMRDPNEDADRRARMAIAAAPFCHSRKGEGSGKEDKAERAKQASSGKFAPSKPPIKLIK